MQKRLVLQTENYLRICGPESEEVKTLKREVKEVNDELTKLRKKEADEVIVLETAPTYLVIPWPFGWIVMAAVLAGVGADLGLLRKKIAEELLPKLRKKSDELGKLDVLFHYHNWANITEDNGRYVTKTLDSLKNITAAWNTITSDLTDLDKKLSQKDQQDALAGDWDFAKADFDIAQAEWERLAAEAAGYLQNQIQPVGTRDVNEAMKGIKLKAVA